MRMIKIMGNPFSIIQLRPCLRPRRRVAGASPCFNLLLLFYFLTSTINAGTFELLPKKSISYSGQFIIYSDDRESRFRLTGVVEEIKKKLLTLLGEKSDHWKRPIVMSATRANAAMPNQLVSSVRLIEVEDGFKIEFDFCLDGDPSEVRLEHQIVRAILLEYTYRTQPPIKEGDRYVEPPTWMVEGVVDIFHRSEVGNRSDIYKALVESDHAPTLEELLTQNTSNLDSTSLALYQACSVALVQLLVELPNGRANLVSYLRDINRDNSRIVDLKKHFPALGAAGQSLDKWWTLSLARLSATERYRGLSMEETDQRLKGLLTLQLPGVKKGEVRKFTLDQFNAFIKIKESKLALAQMNAGLQSLQVVANPQLQFVVLEYQKICIELGKGMTRGISEQIVATENNRKKIVQRASDIEDYMNWVEATQGTVKSGAFTAYLKTAAELSGYHPRRQDAISRYMDNLEIEFQ